MKLSRQWISLFFITIMLILAILEFLSYQARDKFRHEVDYKVYLSEHTTQENIDTILLSDSVTYGPMSKFKLNGNILDLTSNQGISMVGNYFLLQRYLTTHKAPKKVYLFFIYDLFFNNLKSKYTYLYFTTVFTRENEVKLLNKIGRSDVYEKLDYFNIRKANIKKYFKAIGLGKRNNFDKVYDLCKTQNEINEKGYQKRIEAFRNAKLTSFADFFLHKIIKLCKDKNIELTLVVEPMAHVQHRAFAHSPLYGYLKEQSENNVIEFLDVNDYYTFDIHDFHDTIHLLYDFQKKYLDIVDQHIVKLFTYNHDRRISDLTRIRSALEAYYQAYGSYPKSKGFDGLYTAWGESSPEWIKGLVPAYIDKLPRDPREKNNPKEQYLYRSNGKGYKLIAHGVPDCKIVKSQYPELIDPKRDCWAYGFWTEDAENW